MESIIEIEIVCLIDFIERKYIFIFKDYCFMDFGEKVQYFIFDVISDLVFGEFLGYFEKDEDVYDYIKIIMVFILVMLIFGSIFILVNIIQFCFF